eukprot:100506-Chlamydomonas_euryale.AAC.2
MEISRHLYPAHIALSHLTDGIWSSDVMSPKYKIQSGPQLFSEITNSEITGIEFSPDCIMIAAHTCRLGPA